MKRRGETEKDNTEPRREIQGDRDTAKERDIERQREPRRGRGRELNRNFGLQYIQ